MDAPAIIPMPRYIPWLPYWAVLQTDLRQTVRGWVWRTWLLSSLLAAIGYLLYRLGIYREAGIVQHASNVTGDLLRWPLFGTALAQFEQAIRNADVNESIAERLRYPNGR